MSINDILSIGWYDRGNLKQRKLYNIQIRSYENTGWIRHYTKWFHIDLGRQLDSWRLKEVN